MAAISALVGGALAAAGSVIGGVIQGDAQGKAQSALEKENQRLADERKQAQDLRAKYASQLAGTDLNLPEIQDNQVQFQTAENQGNLINQLEQKVNRDKLREEQRTTLSGPDTENAINLGPSAMNDISVDPAYVAAQNASLAQLQDTANSGGFTDIERAKLAEMQNRASKAAQQRREQILQNMAQRGVLGSGMELASSLEGSQSAAEDQATKDRETASLGLQRALEARAQAGNLAGNIRGQEFGEKSQVANANDVISKFNAANQQDVQRQNIIRAQQAKETQFGADVGREQRNVQRDADAAMQEYMAEVQRQQRNVESGRSVDMYNLNYLKDQAMHKATIANQEAVTNAGLRQQTYMNQVGQSAAKYGQQQDVANMATGNVPSATGTGAGMANLAMQSGQQTANMVGNISGALAGAANAYGQYSANKPLQEAQTNYYNAAAANTAPKPTTNKVEEDVDPLTGKPKVKV